MTRLWEVEHPYYCETSNFYASADKKTTSEYASWSEFVAEQGNLDPDLNLLFRWDWQSNTSDWDEGDRIPIHPDDDNYRGYTLSLFWMGQRKGLYRSTLVSVCRADEPAVREWLTSRWKHLQTLWRPVAGLLDPYNGCSCYGDHEPGDPDCPLNAP